MFFTGTMVKPVVIPYPIALHFYFCFLSDELSIFSMLKLIMVFLYMFHNFFCYFWHLSQALRAVLSSG